VWAWDSSCLPGPVKATRLRFHRQGSFASASRPSEDERPRSPMSTTCTTRDGEGFIWLLVPHKTRRPTWQKCWADVRANHLILRQATSKGLGDECAVALPGAEVVALDSLLASEVARWLGSLKVFGFELRTAEAISGTANPQGLPIIVCCQGVDAALSWEQTLSNEARRHGAGQLFVTPVSDGLRCTGAARPESCWCLVVPEVRQLLCYADSQEHAAGRRPLHVIHLARAAVWPYDESAEAGGEAGQSFARLQACSCSAAFIIDEPPARQSAGEEPSRKRTTAFGTHSTGDLKPWLELIQTLCGAGPLRKSFGLGPEEDLERPSWATFWEDSPRKGRPGDHRGSDGSAEGGKTAQEDEQSMEAESSDDEPFSRLARLRPSFALAIREAAQAAAAATAAKGSQNRSVQSSGAAGGEVDGSGFPSVAGDNVAFASIRSSKTSSVASEASAGNPGDGDSFASAASGEETEASSSDDGTEGDQQALRQLQRLSVKLRREGRRLEKELHSGECLARTTLAFFGEKAPNAGALAALQVFLCQISGFAREFAAAVTKVREHQDRRGAKGRAITRVASGTRIGGAKSGAAGRVLAPGPMNMVVPGPMHMVDDGIATPPPPPPPAQRGAGVHRLVVEQPLYPGRAPAQLGQASQ
ncbi:unnamed protein product, partial [Polarella glacialis]